MSLINKEVKISNRWRSVKFNSAYFFQITNNTNVPIIVKLDDDWTPFLKPGQTIIAQKPYDFCSLDRIQVKGVKVLNGEQMPEINDESTVLIEYREKQ